MRIQYIELRNFRKLKSIRIDLNTDTTLCVGANNSGKTSAMVALSTFLVYPKRFTTNDFTLSDWDRINALGQGWKNSPPAWPEDEPTPAEWETFLPSLDLWLHAAESELHFVRDLLPSLEWKGTALGVRLRFEPKSMQALANDYLAAVAAVDATKAQVKGGGPKVKLWPDDLHGFLEKRLHNHFELRYYLLDPTQTTDPVHGIARPQKLPAGGLPLDRNPLDGLVLIDEISAQRGLGDSAGEQASGATQSRASRALSEQMRSYYTHHLDPTEFTELADLQALEAIEQAELAYNERLRAGFADAVTELEQLNYPGVTDPKLTIATRLRPSDGLNHLAAVQYDVCQTGTGPSAHVRRLPEHYNGLGYQNLIMMVFELMSFRDAWMRVGKAGKSLSEAARKKPIERIHLVLIEEPEAYLHAQVQQVFVKKAFDVLRNHVDLKDKPLLTTQLLVSTHSSHIAHECEFACLRYFRRQPPSTPGSAPTSAVINLSEVFGSDDETPRFVTRYLRATHCDLFFADAAIFVEGPAERMLVPQFIHRHFESLYRRYVTVLDIGGSHAHRFRPLVEKLGLTTLIITDLDSADGNGKHPKKPPKRGDSQITRNTTLKKWHPEQPSVDALLDWPAEQKVKVYSEMPMFAVCAAYQVPMKVTLDAAKGPVEALATTFEDALVFENLAFFKAMDAEAQEACESAAEIIAAINATTDPATLSASLFDIVDKLDKAAFALDLLWTKKLDTLQVPAYIKEGLEWLSSQLTRKDEVPVTSASASSKAEAAA